MIERQGPYRTNSRRAEQRLRLGLAAIGAIALACVSAGASALSPEPVPDASAAAAVFRNGANRVRAQLLIHPDADAAGVRVGVLLDMDPGWHVYGPEPGDSGIATTVRWRAEGGRVGELTWPPVETFAELGGLLTTYGYSGEVLLTARLTRAGDRSLALGELQAKIDLLACNVECIPASFRLNRNVAAALAMGDRSDAVTRQSFARLARDDSASRPSDATGVSTNLIAALGLAFLGGLVLNLMPCVLPVLAIKLFSLAEVARRDRRCVLAHTAAYAIGVLTTLLGLAGIVAALRALGLAVGWGFQFQEPLFVAAVAMLLVVLAENFFGVFELGIATGRLAEVGSEASGVRRSFFEGLLVVLLATPCTAPFLGTAVGFAFANSTPVIFAIFAAIGLGLAAPYVVIGLAPGWSAWLPRSGAWMTRLRTALGFVLLATTVWLLWIFSRSAGSDASAALLALLVGVAAGVWAIAQLRETGRPGWTRSASVALAVAGLVGLLSLRSTVEPPDGIAGDPAAEWAPYDSLGVAARLAEGRPVFVAFSADWCITCKLNERNVLASDAVRAAFEQSNAALFLADWTRRDDFIRSELARFERAGVPLYLVYSPEAPGQPEILPEFLRIRDVLAAISSAASPRTVSRITQRSSTAPM